MTIDETTGRSGNWLDVGTLMARASAANDTELAEHGQYQRTLLDEAEMAYTAFKIGVWQLGQENHDEARRWLSTAVESGIVEARPLLRICVLALDPVPEHREALLDADEDALADTLLADAEHGSQTTAQAPPSEDTPIFRAVLDQETADIHQADAAAPTGADRDGHPEPAPLPNWKPFAVRVPRDRPFAARRRSLVISFTEDELQILGPAVADGAATGEPLVRPDHGWIHQAHTPELIPALTPILGQFLCPQSLLSVITVVAQRYQEREEWLQSDLRWQTHLLTHVTDVWQRPGTTRLGAPEPQSSFMRARSHERVLNWLPEACGDEAALALTTWVTTQAAAGWLVHDDVIALLRQRITSTGLILPASLDAVPAAPIPQDMQRQNEGTDQSEREQRPLPGMERTALV